jgi:hypothetical protein
MKEKYGNNYPTFTLNILRFPSFQSPTVLPMEYKISVAKNIREWYHKNGESNLLHDMEREHILRLITYLENVQSPHFGASSIEGLKRDFKNFYVQYDQRRNKNFMQTFPKLATWYKEL